MLSEDAPEPAYCRPSCQQSPSAQQVPFLSSAHVAQPKNVERFAGIARELTNTKSGKPSSQASADEHTTTVTKIGKLCIIATNGMAIDVVLGAFSDAAFLIPYATATTLSANEQRFSIRNKENILYLSSMPWKLKAHCPSFSGLVVIVHPDKIKEAATANRGGKKLDPTEEEQLFQPALLSKDSSHREVLLESIYNLLHYMESVGSLAERLLPSLGLDELLLRSLVQLLVPMVDKIEAEPEDVLKLEQLLDWLEDHCLEPITLADLEARSGYSRRSLQREFKKRFDCGPMQWVCKQRMHTARRRLEAAPQGSRVKDIAMECGYTSLSAFSRDYKQVFARTPRDDLSALHLWGAPWASNVVSR